MQIAIAVCFFDRFLLLCSGNGMYPKDHDRGVFRSHDFFEKISKKLLTNQKNGGIIIKSLEETASGRNGDGKYAPLAQLVEQLTLNQWVPGSNP